MGDKLPNSRNRGFENLIWWWVLVEVIAETMDQQGLINIIMVDMDRILTPQLKLENYILLYHRSYQTY